MSEVVAFGAWPSAVTPEAVAAAGVTPDAVRVAPDGTVWWSERRPAEGRTQIAGLHPLTGHLGDQLAMPHAAASRVHEYGGGSWWLGGGSLFFVNDGDQGIVRLDRPGGPAQTIMPGTPGRTRRYADGVLTPDATWIVCVEEVHPDDPDAPAGAMEPVNRLVAVRNRPGAGERVVLWAGADFVAAPRLSPDGRRLAWISWDHPDLPWDATRLWMADLECPEGSPGLDGVTAVAGADGDAAVDLPEWDADGRLWWVSDEDEWWNLYRLGPDGPEVVCPFDGEVAEPRWVFGGRRYEVLDAATGHGGRVVAAWWAEGRDHLGWLDHEDGPEPWDVPWTSVRSLVAAADGVWFIGASPTEGMAVRFEPWPGTTAPAGRLLPPPPAGLGLPAEGIATPRWITFGTTDGAEAHAQLYLPAHAEVRGPEGARPPLVVMIHGGPTSNALPVLSPKVQFWTSRGWAVADVDYRGSTGYGRTYRHDLDGRWGEVDVADCVDVARYLAAEGLVDPARMVIRGGSAGGFTALAALCVPDTPFAAACGLYAVADLEVLAADTHKFESRYLDRLVAPWPEGAEVYAARSPLHLVDRITRPVLLQQGTEDKVVPPNQAEMMAAALREREVPVELHLFDGEGHGWRSAATIRRSLELELDFYERHTGGE